MISALTSSRIETANKLHKMRNELLDLRSFICFNESELQEIDITISVFDKLINRIMK
jgi:hypothetical protein